jgi:hypothetical protein
VAVATYHDQHGRYPPAFHVEGPGRPAHSWRVALLPYLEGRELYGQYDRSQSWDAAANQALLSRMPAHYAFHGDYYPGLTVTNYLAVVGAETVWPGQTSLCAKDVTDGLSTTILVVENRGAEVQWLEPRDLSFAGMSFALNSPDGVSSKYLDPAVAMLDGSIRRLEKDLSAQTLRALLTANGGERLQEDPTGWIVLPDGRQREIAPP